MFRLASLTLFVLVLLAATLGAPRTCRADGAVHSKDGTYASHALYGDLHLFSANAFTGYPLEVHITPDEAYRFARGEGVTINGQTVRRRSAPLDFLVVTDPAEYLGLFETLYDPNSPFSQTEMGKQLRDPATRLKTFSAFLDTALYHRPPEVPFFGVDPQLVKKLMAATWQSEIEAANLNYRPGLFTTFIGYHWTVKLGGTEDRVVVFKGDSAPPPFTSFDSLKPEDLWTYLESERQRGYETIAIPHNSNLSNGGMFNGLDSSGRPIDATYARRRYDNEPLVEISSNGQSETHPRLSPDDEFANFELFGNEELKELKGSYLRDALGRGLEIAQHIGVNPYKFGFAGDTDFHTGLSDSAENASSNIPDATDPTKPLTEEVLRKQLKNSHPYASGSLTAVWAEENTRDAIFRAFQRREAFATSGTRLKLRLFAGWDYRPDAFKNPHWLANAYRTGVPMGRDLPPKPTSQSAPTLLVWATKDPAGANLDRLQIIKVWLEKGHSLERVYDVALSGDRKVDPITGKVPAVGNTTNLVSATYSNSIGAPELSAFWQDPAFDPNTSAVYYLRVLEIPTPRWSTIAAVGSGIPVIPGPSASIQERGWSSPVYYSPPPSRPTQ